MKSQIKRFSKSTLSVILSLCMIVSCLTVGIIATDAAQSVEERVGAIDNSEAVGATQRYIYCGISNDYDNNKDENNWGFNFWGGTGEGVKSGTWIENINHDNRTYHVFRVQVYDDNNKAQFKGNNNWWDPSSGFDVTLNGTTNNAVFFSHANDGWQGQFQRDYQVTSTASLAATRTSMTTAQSSTLTPSLTSNETYNEIKSTSYSVTTNPDSGGSVTSAGVFTATKAGTYTVTATITYNAKDFSGITKTVTATKNITVTSATYNVSASAGSNGSAVISKISPVSGTATSVSFTNGTTNNVYVKATPDAYYKVDSWTPTPTSTTTDSNGAVTATFSVSSATTISVTFAEEPVYSVVGENGLTGVTSWDISNTSTEMTKSGTSYTKTFNNIAAGTYQFKVAKNHSWTDAVGYSNTVTSQGLVTSVTGANDGNNGLNISFTTSDSSNITITFTPDATVVINAVSNKNKLGTPTNVKFGSSTNTTVTAAPNSSVTLSWTAVTNAGSYEIYKDDVLVTTVSTNSYSIEKKYSNGGVYKVVAVPSNSNSYSNSDKSSGATLTVNRTQLTAPSVTISPTEIAAGGSTTATFSNYSSSLSSYITNGYATLTRGTRAYNATSGAFTSTAAVTSTTGSESLSPASSIQYGYYMAVTSTGSEYYTQSNNSAYTNVYVSSPSYYLVGDLVDSGDNNWSNSNNNFPVDTYDSPNIFKRTITYASGGTNDKHYFRIHNGSGNASYSSSSSQSTDMSSHNTSGTAVTANVNTQTYSMYVVGQGTYTIYVDQSISGSPKVWVVATAPQTFTTTVYVNQDSGATNLYVWKEDTGEIAAWPGENITGTTETVNDIPYYKYTFTGYLDHFSMVVNKGNDTNKTENITNKEGDKTYYVTWNGTHMSTPECSETAPVIQLGYKIGENGTVTYANFTNRSVSLNLAANTTYNFWLKSAVTHLNDENSGTMTRSGCTGWHFPVREYDTKIQTDLAGTYTFTYTVTNGEIYVSVTYPTEPKYNVTINKGDHGSLTVNGSAVSGNSIVVQLGEITKAIVQAAAETGYHFKEWTYTGGVTGITSSNKTSNPITVGANAIGTMTATYEENSYTLTLQSGGNGTITAPSPATLTVHPITATALTGVTVSPANGYKFNGWTKGTGVTLTGGSTTNPAAGTVKATQNSTLTANFTKVSYNLTGVVKLNGTTITDSGTTVKFYSDSACTTQITTAQIGNTVYAKFASDTYSLSSFSKSGTGSTGGSTSGNVYTFTMGYANTTVTANVRPLSSVTYYVDMHNNNMSGKTVNVAVVSNMAGTTTVKDGNGNNCAANLTKQGNSAVYAATINTPVTPSGSSYSELYIKVTYNGSSYVVNLPGSNVATLVSTREMWLEAENEASTQLTLNYNTRSELDVPSGSMTGYNQSTDYRFTVSETDYTAYTNSQGTDYKVKLCLKRGNNTITLADSRSYSYLASFDGDYVLTFIFRNNTVNISDVSPIVRRIYLAKPYSWQTDEPSWENIGIYHWGDYADIGWNSGVKMHYLGKSGTGENDYHYYYVDIPKAIDGNKVSNIIFQGWGTNTTAGEYSKTQTGNIENIPDSANFFILSKDGSAYVGTKSDEDAIIPNYTRYVSSVALNKDENKDAKITPTYTGKISYTSSNTAVVTVDADGTIHPHARGTADITVKIYGTIGDIVKNYEDTDHKDYLTYTVSVTVKDPTQFNKFEIMSLGSQTYTVNVPLVSGNQPGYFDMSNVVMTVEGIKGVTSSTTSAIITTTETTSVSGVGTMPTAFTVKYAKANSDFTGYSAISIIGKVTTKSIRRTAGERYGHDHWEVDGIETGYTTSRAIDGGIETATTNGIPFDDTKSTYSAIFASYQYVDVTFTFTYWEYNPEVDDKGTEDTSDDMINYPYDAAWAGGEVSSNANFAGSHTQKTVTVQNYEVRNKTASTVQPSDLETPARAAIGVMPENNYYNYRIAAGNITISNRNTSDYTASAAVDMSHSVKHYSVYLNGTLVRDDYTYQEYAEPRVNTASNWYAVDTLATTSTSNAPMLASGTTSYKFRVKGNTYIRTAAGTVTDNNFNRSEVDFSHYEVTHQGSTPTTMKEYLLQNFYIADFFSPDKVLDPNSNNGQGNLPYDDAQFVGGGVVYYSMTNGTPFANAVSAGYVNGTTGTIDSDAIKEMLKSNIEAQYSADDIAGTAGEETAMKVAYGTEIEATKNVEGGFNTGIIYRYLPLNQYKRNAQGKLLTPDEDGNYAFDVNTNTFRYSNTLQSYQYVYASGNENKETNAGKNMRLYSYYVYSYLTYNQETNVPETKYEIVISDNYSDASTYWNGN